MAKKEARVSDVISASEDILASNQGKMTFRAWRNAISEKIGAHENALKHILKNKLVMLWLEGFEQDGTPKMWVVNDKAFLVDTTPLTTKESK